MDAATKRILLASAIVSLTSASTPPLLAQTADNSAQVHQQNQDAKNVRLLAAAEPFEALTEQAFTAKPAKARTLVSQVKQAAQKVTPNLSTQEQQQLSERVSEIERAAETNQPHALALASVEGYRVLVSATQNTTVPKAVSLLDYAGFRYSADLKSTPTRWSDMQEAIRFADSQWKSIEMQVGDAKLKKSFPQALMHMAEAVTSRSSQSAHSAVIKELDLVDQLENYFNKH